jgi:hypothetical protein
MAAARYQFIALGLNNDSTYHILHSDWSRAENSACEEAKLETRVKFPNFNVFNLHGSVDTRILKQIKALEIVQSSVPDKQS